MPDNKKYLVDVPGLQDVSGIWETDKWDKDKKEFMTDFPDANVFALEDYDPADEQENDQYYVTIPGMEEDSMLWDSKEWAENKDAFLADIPTAKVQRIRYQDYWTEKAKEDEQRLAELSQPDEERNARLASIGYYDDSETGLDLAAVPAGLMPLSSAMSVNSVSGETVYNDPRVEEFYANDDAYTQRQLEKNRIQAEYDANPRVIERKAWEAEMARLQAQQLDILQKQINEDAEADGESGAQKRQFLKMSPMMGMGHPSAVAMNYGMYKGQEMPTAKSDHYATALNLIELAKQAEAVDGGTFGQGMLAFGEQYFLDKIQPAIKTYGDIGNILTRLEEEHGDLNDLSEEDYDKILTADEKDLILAFNAYNAAMERAGHDMSAAYQGGMQFAGSIPFMLEFIATGGVYSAAGKAALKAAGKKAIGKGFAKWIAKTAGNKAATIAKKAVAKASTGAIKALAGTLAQTVISPSTYTEMMKSSIEYDKEGHLHRGKEAFRGFVDKYIENLSEHSGEGLTAGLGTVGKMLNTNKYWKMSFGAMGEWLGNKAVWQGLSKLGVQSLPVEMAEEVIGNGLRYITGVDKNALPQMFEGDNFAAMVIGFSPMTLIGMGTSAATMGAVSISAANAGKKMRTALDPFYTPEQINSVEGVLEACKTPEQVAAAIKPVVLGMAKGGASQEEQLAVWEYANAIAKKKAVISASNFREMQLTKSAIEQMEKSLGKFWIDNMDGTRTVKQAQLADGRKVFVLGQPNAAGEVAILDFDTKKKGIANVKDIKKDIWVGSIEAFGTHNVMQDRTAKERERMDSERAANIQAMTARLQVENRINLGTEGAPNWVVVDSFDKTGINYINANGKKHSMDWKRVSQILNMPYEPKTDQQMVDEEIAAITRRDAERSAQHNQQDTVGASQTTAAVEGAETAEAIVNAEQPNPYMNEDGTVNETAFWENDPVGYVRWNDEQNQDNGADSLQQIANTKAELAALLTQAQAAQNTSDPTVRKAAKAEADRLAAKIATLEALEQEYAERLKTPEQKRAEMEQAIRERAKEWEKKTGVQIVVVENWTEIDEPMVARLLMMDPKGIFAWTRGGKTAYMYLPNITSVEHLDEKFAHEVVAHIGLPALLGQENFNALLDRVWNSMSDNAKRHFLNYPNVKGRTRVAAEEYLAHIAEKMGMRVTEFTDSLTEEEKSVWQTILDWLMEVFNNMFGENTITEQEIADAIRNAYQNLESRGKAETEAMTAAQQEIDNLRDVLTEEELNEVAQNDLANAKNALDAIIAAAPKVESGETSSAFIERKKAYNEQLNAAKAAYDAKKAIVDALKAQQTAQTQQSQTATEEEIQAQVDTEVAVQGEVVVPADPNKNLRLSYATATDWTDNLGHEHKGTMSQVMERMDKMGFSEEEKEEMRVKMQTMYDYMGKLMSLTNEDGSVRFDEFNEWAKTTPNYKQVGRDYVKAITSLVSNGDYPINLELTTDCIKREAYTQLLNVLVKRGANLAGMGPGEIVTIQKMMKQYGIQVACALCFVEGKRLQIVNWASQIVNDWNDALVEAGVETDEFFGFGKDGDAFIPADEWKTYEDKPKLLKMQRMLDDVALLFQGVDPQKFKKQKAKNKRNLNKYVKEQSEKWAKRHKRPASEWKPNDDQAREMKKIQNEGLAPVYVNENMKEYKAAYEQMRNEWVEKSPKKGPMRDPLDFTPTKKQWETLDKLRNQQIETVKAKMVRLIMEYPEMRKKMTMNDLLGSKGLMEIRQQHGAAYEQLYSIILQRFGTGTPKPVQDAVPYDGEVMTLSESAFKEANKIGGARLFSFSDFDITKVFDYMQMFFDLEANKQMLQSYTKEVGAVLLFGRSNAKFNISTLASAVVPAEVMEEYKKAGEAKQAELRKKWAENAGLVVDAQGNITGINFSEEHSVSPDFAKQIFHDDSRNKDCGAIMVGASVNHAIFSAAQDWIRMVIPFHLSGMPIAARDKTDVKWWVDNTAYQSTRKRTKDGWSKIEKSEDTFEFYADMHQPGWNMRDKAREYLEWCKQQGFRPKFDWGINSDYYRAYCAEAGYTPNQQIIDLMDSQTTDGVWDQYYKFLTDFTAYKPVFNEEGEMIDEIPSPQQRVVTNFDMTELEREVIFEGENSMLARREDNITQYERHLEQLADMTTAYLNGEITEEEMGLRDDVFFDSKQDADAYLDALAKEQGLRLSASVTPQMDAEYMKAIEAGDMETAQRLVLEAAKIAMPNTKVVDENGNPLVVYHGTNNEFNVFEEKFSSSNTGAKNGTIGFYFTPVRSYAEYIGRGGSQIIKSVFLNITNPLEVGYAIKSDRKYHNGREQVPFDYSSSKNIKDGLGEIKKSVIKKFGSYTPDNVAKWKKLTEQFVDGLIVMTGDSPDFERTLIPTAQYVAFNPNQIKSADPITYDDNGNVIPLSERFNPQNEDIRFSMIGEVGAARDKSSEGLIRMENLEVARQMEKELNPDWSARASDNALKIKVATGWERGADGKWRYEVEDIKAKPLSAWLNSKKKLKLKDIVEPNLILDLYPNIGEITIIKGTSKQDWGAVYFDETQEIKLPFGALKAWSKLLEIYGGEAYSTTLEQCKNAMLTDIIHEVQHAIQHREGFARGGSPSMIHPAYQERYKEMLEEANKLIHQYNAIPPYDRFTTYADRLRFDALNAKKRLGQFERDHAIGTSGYKRLGGEVEAKNAEKRWKMSEEERRNTLLAETEDVNREDQWIIYDEENNSDSSIRFSASNSNQAIFVSNAAVAVNAIKMEKATPEQWLKMIEKNGGLKAGEDKWMGLSDWLKAQDKKTLTKQEVLDFIGEHMIQIEEQHYGEINQEQALRDEATERIARGASLEDLQAMVDENAESASRYDAENEDEDFDLDEWLMDIMVDEYGDDFRTAYTIEEGVIEFAEFEWWDISNEDIEDRNGVRRINDDRLTYTTNGLTDLHEIALTVPTIKSWGEDDTIHFGDAGEGRAVAWIRFGDTEKVGSQYPKAEWDAIGKFEEAHGADLESMSKELRAEYLRLYKEFKDAQKSKKVLVIDEIQSKRHQEAREEKPDGKVDENGKKEKKGYRDDAKIAQMKEQIKALEAEQQQIAKDILHKQGYRFHDEEEGKFSYEEEYSALSGRIGSPAQMARQKEIDTELYNLNHSIREMRKGIPAAPFENNWHELAMKRMLRYAAENGYDVVAWTKGDQQAERYSLAKSVQGIEAWDRKPSSKIVRIKPQIGMDMLLEVDSEGKIVDAPHYTDYKGKQLSELVGKELAVALMQPGDVNIEGDGLTIGGEGMKGFYDKMLPAFMNKYGKKWGIKVEDIELPNLEKNGLTMHSIPVTEEMKESVMGGQVMFSANIKPHQSSMQEVTDMFFEWNEDAALEPIFRKVLEICNELNMDVKFVSDDEMTKFLGKKGARGLSAGEKIRLNADEFNKASNQKNASTILHEMIHIASSYVFYDMKNYTLSPEQTDARKELEAIFNEIKDKFPDMYGTTNVREMIAEMANPEFRLAMKEGTLWERFVNAIRKLLGLETKDHDKLTATMAALNEILDSPDFVLKDMTIPRNNSKYLRFSVAPEVRAEMDRIAATAIIDGNYMLAPNGQPTKLTADQWAMVRTQNFKNWFGDWENDPENASKVVDPETGEPRVVYHGTTWNPMKEKPGKAFFDDNRVGQNFDNIEVDNNFFFTASEEAAKGYGTPVPVFLNIRNMDTHIIKDDAFKGNPAVLDAHEMIIEAHDFGGYEDTYVPVENSDGARWTLNSVDDTKALEKHEADIREWESRYGEAIEERKKQIKEESDSLRDEVRKLYEEVFDKAGVKQTLNEWYSRFGIEIGEYRELKGDMKRLADIQIEMLLQHPTELTADIAERYNVAKKRMDELASESLQLIYNRESLEGFPKYDASLEVATDYTLADVYALDNPNQIKSATDNTGDFSESNDIRFSAASAKDLLNQMQATAETLVPRELTKEIWKNEIEGVAFYTPVGEVRFGENQYDKNIGKGRAKEFGMLIPTIVRPDLVFEENDREEGAERQTKYVFVKTFVDESGEKHINYASISVKKEGMEVITSSHRLRDKQVLNKIEKEQMLWNRFASDSASSAQGGSTDQSNALSESKGTNNFDTTSDFEGNLRFSVRTKPAPAKTQPVYKLMRLGEDGRLYPLYIDSAEGIETGVWYDADSPSMGDIENLETGYAYKIDENGKVVETKKINNTGKSITQLPSVKQVNQATTEKARWIVVTTYADGSKAYYNAGINGSGQVSVFGMRPGWHAGSLPTMRQIGKATEEVKARAKAEGRKVRKDEKIYRDDNFVWVRGRIPADIDYQPEADQSPTKDIQTHIPVDGFYLKATNADKVASQADRMGWYIAGSFIADEIISDAEARRVIDQWNEEHPDAKVEYDFARESGREYDPARGGLVEAEEVRFSSLPVNQVLNTGLALSTEDAARLAGDIFSALPESVRNEVVEATFKNGFDMQTAIFQIPARLAEKQKWDAEDRDLARVIRDEVQKAVDGDMPTSRPLTAAEALWVLYRSTNAAEDSLIGAARMSMVAHNLGFNPSAVNAMKAADEHIRFSAGSNAANTAAVDFYNYDSLLWTERMKEAWLDMNQAVINLQNALEKATGKKIESWENLELALNQLSSKNYAEKKKYMRDYLEPLWDAVLKITEETDFRVEDVERYLMLKHGLERNRVFAARDARTYYNEMFEKIDEGMRTWSDAKKNAALSDAQAEIDKIMDEITDAISQHGKAPKRLYDRLDKAKTDYTIAEKVLRNDKKANAADLQAALDAINNGTDARYLENRKKDYGGLTAMYSEFDPSVNTDRSAYNTEEEYQRAMLKARKPKYTEVDVMEDVAQDEVDRFERWTNGLTNEVWKRINAATKETLRHQYANNMITEEQYNAVKDMFKYYVPLRGFDANTAGDMYAYYSSGNNTGFANPLMGAKGRTTLAESPLGWIGAMADSAIQMDNKNDAKMRLYYALLNRPDNGLVSIQETWYEFTGQTDANGRKIFAPKYPPKTSGALTADEMAQHIQDFEDSMRKKQAIGEAYKSSQRVNLHESVIFQEPQQESEHCIRIKVAGKDFTMLINGNPRAAQAINGMLNPDTKVGPFGRVYGELRRGMSSLLTSFSPLFWIANFQRDQLSSVQRTQLGNGGKAMAKFMWNRLMAWRVAKYIYVYGNEDLGNSYYENLYREFADNGGITGYTVLTRNSEYDDMLKKYARDVQMNKIIKGLKKGWNAFMDFGEAIEQVSRFAAYITARESGMDIIDAVNAAKEVSVNFNRKGSTEPITMEEAAQLRKKNGKPLSEVEQRAVVAISCMPGIMKECYFFFNASIQALSSSAKLAKKSPGSAAAWAGLYLGVSFMMSIINSMFGDDDDEYLDLPDYVRQSTLLIPAGDGYIKWSIPQEMRPFYAAADILVQDMVGNMPHKNIGTEMALAMAEWLPVNPFGSENKVLALIPDAFAPIAEIAMNENTFGSKVYNDMSWLSDEVRKNVPKHRKATSKTGEVYVDLSEAINAMWGGDDVVKKGPNFNPANLEHLVEGYLGGQYDLWKMFGNLASMLVLGEKPKVKEIPFVNKVFLSVDETNMYTHTNDIYNHYKGISDDAKRIDKEYRANGMPEKADAYRETDNWRIHQLFLQYESEMKEVSDLLKVTTDENEVDLLRQRQNALRELLLEDISKNTAPDPVIQIDRDLARISKENNKVMKPGKDARKAERKAQDDKSISAEEYRRLENHADSLQNTEEYKAAEEFAEEIKEVRGLLKELESIPRGEQRDSVVGELQRKYDALVKKSPIK